MVAATTSAISPTNVSIAEVLGVDSPNHTGSSPGIDDFDVVRAEATYSANVAFTRKFADLRPEPKVKAAVRPVESVEDSDLSHIPDTHRRDFITMLRKHASKWNGSLGKTAATEHIIELIPGARPFRLPTYRVGPTAREQEAQEVRKMLEAGVIRPSSSEWASPGVTAPKPDRSPRLCIHYRRLNALKKRHPYPILRMDECIESRGEAVMFSALDANCGYWQVPIRRLDMAKTAFACHAWILFRLTNATATFQRAVNIILSKYKWQTCLVYLDDIIIFSSSMEEHTKQVDIILDALRKARVSVNLRKCHFFTKKIKYLGHIIRPGSFEIAEASIATLTGLRHPRKASELR